MTLPPAPPPRLLLPAVCTRRPAALALDTVVCSDVIDYLRSLPDESVNCVVTSPPYFGLRDYGVEGQIGLEPTPQQFVATMVAVFREVRRVLRRDGVCWVNLGDSYAGGGGYSPDSPSNRAGSLSARSAGTAGARTQGATRNLSGFKTKDLIGIPWRVAFALQDDGWYLRSDCIWAKPNPMPESVTDRPTKSHEYVFLLTKSERYWYDQEAIREPSAYPGDTRHLRTDNTQTFARPDNGSRARTGNPTAEARNARTVWTIATEPTPFAHFATFPSKLVERCVLAGCPDRVCSSCGAPWERVTEATGGTIGRSWHDHSADLLKGMTQARHSGGVGNARDGSGNHYRRETSGYRPTCACHADTHPGVVLDPFMGSGTVGLVARRLGRHYIGCDLNPEYVSLANGRPSRCRYRRSRSTRPPRAPNRRDCRWKDRTMTLKEAQQWIDLHHKAGAKWIGASCNPIKREIYLTADDARIVFKGPSQRETRILKDILHDYIGRLPQG